MNLRYDERNDHIYCTKAYDHKEILKAMGFRWDQMTHTWIIDCPKDLTVMGNLICDVFVDCKMDYYDLCDFVNDIVSVKGEFSMDDDHLVKFQAATENV